MKLRNIIYALPALALTATGCIDNDIPYPHIQANFLTISATGQETTAFIDSTNLEVTFYLPEDVDIQNVTVSDYTLTPGAEVVGDALSGPLDLSTSKDVTLHLYYDYTWKLSAVQDINRYFTVDGQIGASVIDAAAHTVSFTVNDRLPLDRLHVLTCKLGATGSVMTPVLEGQDVDFTRPVEVTVSQWGRSETWTITANVVETLVSTVSVDAWTQVAWVYGTTEASRPYGVQYRLQGTEEWTDAPEAWLTREGGSFHARLIHLSPATAYEARAVSGDQYGDIVAFTTGTNQQPPNADFDNWWLDGKVWCPWAENGTPYWGTGNKGATTLGQSNTTPSNDTPTGTGMSAQLLTKFVGIGALGKLAAGNIFVGEYVRTDGTNGILAFGREFTQRPTKVRGYMKYTTAPISHTTTGFESLKGQPDTCIIWCSLIDQDTPFEIRTRPSNRQLFDSKGPYVVAYGQIESGDNITEWVPFEFELNYTSTGRVPRFLLITASASKYGDYFTGGNGATLWLDDIVLEYDY